MSELDYESMDGFITSICSGVSTIGRDESNVAAFEYIAKKALKDYKAHKESRGRGKNLRVTDISNPMQAYFDIKYPDLPVPVDLQSKFNYGKAIERKVDIIFQKKPNYVPSQGQVNGSAVKMPNIRGRLDFRLGSTIVEFKTSEYDIDSVGALLEKNPQDLRQLLLYILFTGRERDDHRLLYLCGRYPNLTARSFRVKIKDRQKLIKYFKETENGLSKAVENNDPSGLGKCEYYDSICKFKEAGLCHCSTETKSDLSVIKDNVFLKLIGNDLDKEIQNFDTRSNLSIKLWDVFTPRRWYLKESNPYDYIEQDQDSLEEFEVRKFIENELVNGKVLDRNSLLIDGTLFNDYILLVIDNETNSKPETVYPVIVRSYNERPRSTPIWPSPAHKAQLGLICALYGSKTGFLFVFYNNPQIGILFKIEYTGLENIKESGIRIMQKMGSAFLNEIPVQELQGCPNFVVNEFECYMDCPCNSPHAGS